MDHVAKFESLISAMKLDGRYRTFIELERLAGEFPTALWHAPDGRSRRVTVWCSNDYLGMGQHPDVLAAMHRAIDLSGAGTGGTRNISGTNRQHVELEAELADLHGKDAALIFTSGWISNLAALGTIGQAPAGLRDLLGRAQPQFDDRRYPSFRRGAASSSGITTPPISTN